jgi:hypothetical protein
MTKPNHDVELRNMKHSAFASEETYCFEATVWINGVRAGHVANQGHGGPHRYHPHDLQKRLDEIGKTQPPVKLDDYTLTVDADLLISELVSDWLLQRDLKNALSKRILFRVGEKVMQSKTMKKDVLARHLSNPAKLRAEAKTEEVLNLMPFDQAMEIYRAGAPG